MRTSAASEQAIWDPIETGPRERLRELQLERLRATVARTIEGQPPFAARLADAGIGDPGEIRSIDDLARLPFSRKSDLRENYPFGLLAVPRDQVVRVHASSGSHGKPTVVGYTRADLEAWTEVMARCMTMAGVRPGMVVHNANGYGLFTGGLGFHYGGERIGATVVPASGGFTARQAMLLADLGGQALCATPSYALVIAQAIRDAGIDPGDLALEIGLFGGEPWTDEMRRQLDGELGIQAVSFYGLSEMCGPGVAAECLDARDGLHVQEDHFLAEVVDPETGEALPEGAEGELVFTALAKEAQPLIRYRTGDIGSHQRRALRLRPHDGPDHGPARPARRHADHSRGQPLPLARRDAAARRRGGRPPLPPDRRAPGRDGRGERRMRARLSRDRPRGARRAPRGPAPRPHGDPDPRLVVEPGAVPRSEGKAVRVVDRRQTGR